MQLKNVGVQVAIREFQADGKSVTVLIGRPEKFPDGDDHYCPYQIFGIGNERVRYAGGVDAVQALQLALKMVGAELYTSPEAKLLSWVGGSTAGDLGFPLPNSVIDLAP